MADLENIEAELSQAESVLEGPRRYGRAMMNSVGDSLRNVGRRLQRSLSATSADSSRERLSRRLELAELAYSSRRPLELVQQHALQQQLQATNDESSPPIRDNNEIANSQSQRSTGSQRRPSLLLASRHSASQKEGFEYSLEHYESGVGAGTVASASGAKQSKLEALDETDRESSFGDESLEEAGVDIMDTKMKPPIPVLLSRNASNRLSRVFSDSTVSGSILHHPLPVISSKEEEKPSNIIYSWGLSGLQSLHDNDTPRSVENALVGLENRLAKPGGSAVVSLATSSTHSVCALAKGLVLTWGQNVKGVVDPYARDTQEIPRPTLFEPINDLNLKILQVSCGYDHTAALSEHGTVLTWGSNEFGQLGHRQRGVGNNNNNQQPKTHCSPQGLLLEGGQRAASVACGYYFTLVLTTRMCVLACGDERITGKSTQSAPEELAADQQAPPIKPPSLANSISALLGLPLVAIAAGHNHAIVITSLGVAYAWGKNETGCCGRPFPKRLSVPVEVHVPGSTMPTTKPTISAVENPMHNWEKGNSGNPKINDDVAIIHACAGAGHTCFVTRSGRLLVCGSNSYGQLGLDEDNVSPAKPLDHPESGRGCYFVSAEAGSFHTLLLDSEGSVWKMSGKGGKGGLECVLKGKKIVSIVAGGDQSIALAQNEGTRRRQFSIAHTCNTDATAVDSNALANSLEELMDIEPQDEEKGIGEEVARRIEELLQNPSVMNSVFFDPTELDKMVTQLTAFASASEQQTIATAIERGISKGLKSIAPDCARMMYPEAVRCLLLYIRFFDCPFEDQNISFDLHGNIISALMETILELPFEGYKAFLQWATSLYSGDLFIKMLVKPLLGQLDKSLKVTVDDNEVAHASLSLGAVPLIVSVLQWFHKVSVHVDGFGTLEDFYSYSFDALPTETLFDDLYHLKMAKKANKQPTQFHICGSPFLFSPKVKQELLQIESQIEMFKVASADGVAIDPDTGSMKMNPFWKLEIEREYMLEQTLESIKHSKPSDLRKKLQVVFKGEEGVDAGGVTREFFQLLSEELFDVTCSLWTDRFGDDVTWFNSDCSWDTDGFEAAGVLVGLALYNSTLLDVHFPMAVYRKLLGYPLGLEDMVDETLKKGFQQLLDYENESEIEYVFCLSFEVAWTDILGKEKIHELKPGGSDIPVTGENKEEYVRLYTKWLLVDSIDQQWEAFERGVMRIIEGLSLDLLFRPEELKLLVVGSPELDFDALESNTEYEGGYDGDSAVIKHFWKWIKNVDRESQLKFLKFTAGSSMSPIGGLGNLGFKIQRAGPDSPQLPTSHTCFNTLLLPEYDSYEKLEERLTRAILECEGFGLS